jgi:hypothetical protein
MLAVLNPEPGCANASREEISEAMKMSGRRSVSRTIQFIARFTKPIVENELVYDVDKA